LGKTLRILLYFGDLLEPILKIGIAISEKIPSKFGDIGAFFPQKISFAPSHIRFVVELMVRKFAPQLFFFLFF
jgi:hypothetical protein